MQQGPWCLRSVDEGRCTALARTLDVHPLVARVLMLRGFDTEETAARFLHPRLADLAPPDGLPDLEPVVERISRGIVANERIGIFGDYDVDGISATALLGDFLRQAGGRTVLRVARRQEGYGFQTEQAREMAALGCTLLILVDCGSSDHAAVRRAREGGLDVVALDHHQVNGSPWPGMALVNPQREGSQICHRDLTSVGLTFYLAARLRRNLEALGLPCPDPRQGLDLVALGTIADVAPLRGSNRILVSSGLRLLAHTPRPGLRELLRLCNLGDRPPRARDVGFRIGPRLNAPGRLGDAAVALDCLLLEEASEAANRAKRCHEQNEERRQLQEPVMQDALTQGLEQTQSGRAFVLAAGEGWHSGVLGIVAARLTERFGRPAAAVSLGDTESRGSARGVPGVDLVQVLRGAEDLLIRYGGHAAAAGFALDRPRLSDLHDRLHRLILPLLEQQASPFMLDGELTPAMATIDLYEQLQKLEPHGAQNPEPVFLARQVKILEAKRVGQGHLLLKLDGGCDAIGYGMAEQTPDLSMPLDLAFQLGLNTYRQPRVQLRLTSLRPAGRIESGP